jgi:hypothetical protein
MSQGPITSGEVNMYKKTGQDPGVLNISHLFGHNIIAGGLFLKTVSYCDPHTHARLIVEVTELGKELLVKFPLDEGVPFVVDVFFPVDSPKPALSFKNETPEEVASKIVKELRKLALPAQTWAELIASITKE